MKIGLISPKGLTTGDQRLEQIFKKSGNVQGYIDSLSKAFSSGLLIVAALTPKDIEIKLIDENFDVIDFNEKFDVVALSGMTQQATRAYEIADEFKKRNVKVVMGGIHATVMPKEAKKYCDSVFIGEAEDTWPNFLNDFKINKISEFYKSNKLIDLKKSPLPRYDLLKPENYKVIWMQTSRGCPHDCEFCGASRVYGFKYRHKTIDQIVEEIKVIQNIWPDARINFSDDNLLVDRRYAKQLMYELEKLNIRWFAQSDISIVKEGEFLKLIKSAGCTTLFIGFESVSEESLSLINKNNWKLKQLPNYAKAIEIIQSEGIGIVGAFIIGLDGDTTDAFDELTNFIIENNIFISQIAILTPLPGTRLYERLKKENRLLNKPWTSYTFTEVTYIPKNMTVEELQSNLYKIYEKTYSPEVRLKVLKHFKAIFKKIS